jgi:hypothetical protein
LARTRHAKTETRTHTSMPENFGAKRLTKVVKICVKIMPDFMPRGLIDVKRNIMMSKWRQIGVKEVSKLCWLMYTGFSRFGPAISGHCCWRMVELETGFDAGRAGRAAAANAGVLRRGKRSGAARRWMPARHR